MPTQEDIDHQQRLLERSRRRLMILEEQLAGFGQLHAPAHLSVELKETRAEIARLEAALRVAGLVVEAHAGAVEMASEGAVIVPTLISATERMLDQSLFRSRFPLIAGQVLAAGVALGTIPTTALGFGGFALLLFGLGILAIADLPIQRLRYTFPTAAPPPSSLGLLFGAMLIVCLLAALIGAYLARRPRAPIRLFGGLLAVVLLVALVLALLIELQNPAIAAAAERAAPTGASTQPPAPTAPGAALTAPIPPYRADLAVDGPTTMRVGTSGTLVLTITVIANTSPQPGIPLAASSGYTTTAQLQPGNFEVGATVAGLRDAQPLALQSPAHWAWVIAPKDQSLGDQALVVDLFISDLLGAHVGTPFASIGISVTDLLGLPPPIGYIIGGLASLLGAILSAIGVGAWIGARLLKTPDAAPTTSPQPVTNPVAVASLLSAPAAPSPIMPILNAELPEPAAQPAATPPVRRTGRRKAKDATKDAADDQ